MARPLVALPAYPVKAGRVDGWRDPAVAIPEPYVGALQRAGAQEAVLGPVDLSDGEARSRLDSFDGLLLAGGGDVLPSHYGQQRDERTYGTIPVRDTFEMALCRAAIEMGLPILAICRGTQVLNVVRGGTLSQHISDEFPGHGMPGVEGGQNVHAVDLTPGTRVAGAMAVTEAACSCHHHQAIDRVGDGLTVTARSPDGIVEAVELAGETWVVAVQWHPEDTAASDPVQQRLFDTFVAQCGR
ncbi:MAG: gamma-glutamyl-gamma-aminobutyrate hydrolase family protein [Actinobacteria bacterium]|nr:gamma-glutamyl-gamma-aminobutyrate hydrolase family protein [Actinomycetota bacterium]